MFLPSGSFLLLPTYQTRIFLVKKMKIGRAVFRYLADTSIFLDGDKTMAVILKPDD